MRKRNVNSPCLLFRDVNSAHYGDSFPAAIKATALSMINTGCQVKVGQQIYARMVATMSDDIEVLLSQLTLDEKISLIAGKSQWRTASIERLGIPSLKVSEVIKKQCYSG